MTDAEWRARPTKGWPQVSDTASTTMVPTMVPLMAATLITVLASRVLKIGDSLGGVAAVTPFYAAFLVIMALRFAVTCLFRLDVGAGRAIVFSGATRTSPVVLPLALALPDALAVAAVVVVTQTLVEMAGMVLSTSRVVPRLRPAP